MPPDATMWPQGDSFEGPLGLQNALGEPVDGQPVRVDDMPLSQLESPAVILQGQPMIPSQTSTAGNPVQTAGAVTGQPAAAQQSMGARRPVGSGVNHNAAAVSGNGLVPTADGYAPAPIRKNPVWVPTN